MKFIEYREVPFDPEANHFLTEALYCVPPGNNDGIPSEITLKIVSDPRLRLKEEVRRDLRRNESFERRWLRFCNEIIGRVDWSLEQIISLLHADIKDKVILDLGCGSNGETEDLELNWEMGIWQPWLCRFLQGLGAHPIGMDAGNLLGEKFESYRVNLLDPNSLDNVPDNSVDLVHSRLLYCSPNLSRLYLQDQYQGWGTELSSTGLELARSIVPQLERVLKPNKEYLYYDDRSSLDQKVARWDQPSRYRWPFTEFIF